MALAASVPPDRAPDARAMMRIAGLLYVVVGGVFVACLVALASGVSWATLARGRAPGGPLAPRRRALVVVVAVARLLVMGLVATRAGLLGPTRLLAPGPSLWIIGVIDLAAAVSYGRTSDWVGRRLWAPLCALLAALMAVVLLTR
ncbi:MAG TPA: hypothetical protein VGH98_05820 [Gemmatimonadaceae bacterium]